MAINLKPEEEQKILEGVARGKTNENIAKETGIPLYVIVPSILKLCNKNGAFSRLALALKSDSMPEGRNPFPPQGSYIPSSDKGIKVLDMLARGTPNGRIEHDLDIHHETYGLMLDGMCAAAGFPSKLPLEVQEVRLAKFWRQSKLGAAAPEQAISAGGIMPESIVAEQAVMSQAPAKETETPKAAAPEPAIPATAKVKKDKPAKKARAPKTETTTAVVIESTAAGKSSDAAAKNGDLSKPHRLAPRAAAPKPPVAQPFKPGKIETLEDWCKAVGGFTSHLIKSYGMRLQPESNGAVIDRANRIVVGVVPLHGRSAGEMRFESKSSRDSLVRYGTWLRIGRNDPEISVTVMYKALKHEVTMYNLDPATGDGKVAQSLIDHALVADFADLFMKPRSPVQQVPAMR